MDDMNAVSQTQDRPVATNARSGQGASVLHSLPPPGLSDQAKRWNVESADAIQAWNNWIEQDGMPLDDLRRG